MFIKLNLCDFFYIYWLFSIYILYNLQLKWVITSNLDMYEYNVFIIIPIQFILGHYVNFNVGKLFFYVLIETFFFQVSSIDQIKIPVFQSFQTRVSMWCQLSLFLLIKLGKKSSSSHYHYIIAMGWIKVDLM